MTFLKLTTGAALASIIAVTALAHGGATGIVKERMDGMSALKNSMKTLTPMMQGKTPYDADVVRREAEQIGRHAGDSMTRLFPDGSGGKPSEAKPEIWSDWDEFSELAEQLHTYSQGLELAAENGLMVAGTGQGASMMGGESMMGGGSMMGAGMMDGSPDQAQLSEMPADGVFMMLSQTCSACHTQFRSE